MAELMDLWSELAIAQRTRHPCGEIALMLNESPTSRQTPLIPMVCPLQLFFQICLQRYGVVVLCIVGAVEQRHITTLSRLQQELPCLRMTIQFGGIAVPELIPLHRHSS
jgi:hypothetical protein